MSVNLNNLIEKASELGIEAYPLESEDIAVENRISLKCAFGCASYGKRLSCPPHIPSIDEFRKILGEYSKALLLVEVHDTKAEPDLVKAWSRLRKNSFHKMLELEREAFRKGFTYAHLLRPGSCNECEKCGKSCANPQLRRFAPEAVGINLPEVMKKAGLELEFCKPGKTSCLGILLVD